MPNTYYSLQVTCPHFLTSSPPSSIPQCPSVFPVSTWCSAPVSQHIPQLSVFLQRPSLSYYTMRLIYRIFINVQNVESNNTHKKCNPLSMFGMLCIYVYKRMFQFLPITSNFAQLLKRSGTTFHRPQSTA